MSNGYRLSNGYRAGNGDFKGYRFRKRNIAVPLYFNRDGNRARNLDVLITLDRDDAFNRNTNLSD